MTVDRRQFNRSLFGPLALAAVAPSLLGGCEPGERTAPLARAPDIGYTLLDGRPGQLAALRDKVVLVNFWATSCAVCVQEMPHLVDTWRKFSPRGVEMLAVAMRHDPPALVARYAERHALPFGVVIDNTGAIARAFGDVQATPTTFVIDKSGGIAKRLEGAPDFAALHRLVDELLAQKRAA
jgi:peroxiredoxin